MEIETHPFEPFLPENARLLILGTFPPAPNRWCMPFYYPNFQNDMWRIMGHIFYADKMYFVDNDRKTFRLDALKAFLSEKGIALYDTAYRIIRTRNTASDKDLQIVEESGLDSVLRRLPRCESVLTAGRLATRVFTEHYGVKAPVMGDFSEFSFDGRSLRLYRMPSSSRAYPMKLEDKAECYRKMFTASPRSSALAR